MEHAIARDNVIFEFGMYVGHLGRERSLIVAPRNEPLHLPSDLLGINYLTYQNNRTDNNLIAALGPAAFEINNLLRRFTLDDYGIKITYPRQDDEVPIIFTATGTFVKEPPQGLVYAIMLNERSGEYWPKRELLYDPYTNTWRTEVNNRNATTTSNTPRTLIIAAVGKHAKELINFQKKAGNQKDAWVGLNSSDTIREEVKRLALVTIRLKG